MSAMPSISNFGKVRIVKLALNKGQSKLIPGMVERGMSVREIARWFNITEEKTADYIRVFGPAPEENEPDGEAREHETEVEAPRVQPGPPRKTRGKGKARKGG